MIEIDEGRIRHLVADSLSCSDGGEIFFEDFQREFFSYKDGVLDCSDFSARKGFGLRSFVGEKVALIHSSGFEMKDIEKAAASIKSAGLGSGSFSASLNPGVKARYKPQSPLGESSFAEKVELLRSIDGYLRSKSELVKQVVIHIDASLQQVKIVQPESVVNDYRPMVRIRIQVIVQKGERSEIGSSGLGGRDGYSAIFKGWQKVADDALKQGLVNLESIPVSAGEMIVVLGNGFPGVLLHEAVGHGLEGDANRKKSSAFCELMGKRVASPGVNVVDNGTLFGKRGSLNVDDEGNAARCNLLIEDGVLISYMNDGINGRLLGSGSSGNGRRESYAHLVMPRMTNTYMLSGDRSPEEIIASVDKGIYAVGFGGGQVDTTSGKFVFSTCEAYMIDNGKITEPIKNTTLIGNGPDILTRISMIGNDSELDSGTGTCGKAGQSVPVCVGQPTLRIDGITVGGSQQ